MEEDEKKYLQLENRAKRSTIILCVLICLDALLIMMGMYDYIKAKNTPYEPMDLNDIYIDNIDEYQ